MLRRIKELKTFFFGYQIKTLKYIPLLFFVIIISAQEMSTISGFVRNDAMESQYPMRTFFLVRHLWAQLAILMDILLSPMCQLEIISY
ncbi:MAG: hypothetical protein Ct9H300mP18_09050 [Candidatus Neomarinimicrobiota bacterium]|nr:MAG: hypothetical protein Ct9H300mP18_09050 [Candidatus Neomarinimicrobiota bacterium]